MVRKWGISTLLAVGLVCGVAHGASDSATVPGAGDFMVSAVVTPGSSGGGVTCFGKQEAEESVKFSIGSGALEVRGEACGTFDPAASYSVDMNYYEVAGQLMVDLTVTNNDTTLVVYSDAGVPAERPDSITAEGDIASVSVN